MTRLRFQSVGQTTQEDTTDTQEWSEKVERFNQAHANPTAGFDAAIGQLQAGRKVGHWVWYIFPQLEGLGKSNAAQRFALADEEDAWAYVAHPLLGARLALAFETVVQYRRTLHELMADPVDARKLVSSLTLFYSVCQIHLHDADKLLAARARAITMASHRLLKKAAGEGLPKCAFTLQAMRSKEVCGACGVQPAPMVTASGVAPVSYPRCLDCQIDNVEAEWVWLRLHEFAAELGLPDMTGQKTLVDGHYLSWDEWLALKGLSVV